MDAVNRQQAPATDKIFAQSHVIYTCFFLSGFAALIYQVAWQRLALRILGSTLPAVSVVLAVFMAGLALGALVATRFLPRVRNPLLVYASIESGVAIFGLLSLAVFQSGPNSLCASFMSICGQILGQQIFVPQNPFDWHFWLRAGFVTSFLLIPTTLMGATFTVLGKYFERSRSLDQTRNPSASAYLANLTGAAFGTICSGFVLMPKFGLSVSIVTASLLSVLVAAVVFAVCRSIDLARLPEPASFVAGKRVLRPRLLCAVALVSGMVGLILEVVWSRLFSLLLGSSTYSLAAVLSVYMIGLVIGLALVLTLGTLIRNEVFWIAILSCALAASLYGDLWIIQICPSLLACLHLVCGSTFSGYMLERFLLIALVVLPPAAITGGIFPLALQALASDWNNREKSLGLVYAFNTMGSVLGALSAGLVFVPYFGSIFASGMECTISLVVFLCLTMAVILFLVSGKWAPGLLPVLLVILMIWVRPPWNKTLLSAGVPFLSLPPKVVKSRDSIERLLGDSSSHKLLFYREGLNTTVTVQSDQRHNIIYLKNDGKVEAALPIAIDQESPGSDLITEQMLGQLPFAFRTGPLHTAFVVGLGSGATCGATLALPEVAKLTVAEVEPAIYAAQYLFQSSNGAPLRKNWLAGGRVVPLCEDARAVLNFSTDKFDVIISQPAEPWISGSADLYSTEFWQLCKSKLALRGVFSQWIQLYAIDPQYLGILCRTFQAVFPNTYAIHHPGAGELILIGCQQPLKDAQLAGLEKLIVATPQSLQKACGQIGALYSDARLNTDDNMAIEYGLPQRLYLSGDLIDRNLKAIAK